MAENCVSNFHKPKLGTHELSSLRWHCIKNQHSSIPDKTTWARDYSHKSLSRTTIPSHILECSLVKICRCHKYPEIGLTSETSGMDHHTVKPRNVVTKISGSDFYSYFLLFRRNGCTMLRTTHKKGHPGCYQQQVPKPESKLFTLSRCNLIDTAAMADLMEKKKEKTTYTGFKMESFRFPHNAFFSFPELSINAPLTALNKST